jgi:hypothetical protein
MPDFIEQLRGRLAELGCPPARLRRMVREMADHREDLVRAASANGLSAPGALDHADAQLGNPLALAEDLMVTFRRSSWWGRYYLVAFGFLPLLAYPLLWVLFLTAGLALEFAVGFGWNEKKLHAAANNPVTFHHWAAVAHGADYLAIALVAFLFCWLARRSGVSLAWMLIACLVCSTYALVSYTHIDRHNYSAGLTWHPQWTRAAIPILVVGTIYLRHRWLIHVLRRPTAV